MSFVESKARGTYDGGSGRGNAWRCGGAGQVRAGLDADGLFRTGDDRLSWLPKHGRQLS